MNKGKALTVFLPTLNSQLYLVEALESIRLQTFEDFEVHIVDGGSIDLTAEICLSYCRKDSRFSFCVREGTTPIERFNEVLADCKTEFLAIAHSDDIQHPTRFDHQINYMHACNEIILSGTDTIYWLHDFLSNWVQPFAGIAHYPRSHEEITVQLPFWWCFANPTLVFKTQHFIMNKLFMDSSYKYSSDYLFYWRTAQSGKVGNLDEALVAYRMHSQSEGPMNRKDLEIEGNEIRHIILEESGLAAFLGPELSRDILDLKIERNIVTRCPANYKIYEHLFERMKKFPPLNIASTEGVIRLMLDNYLEQIGKIKESEDNSEASSKHDTGNWASKLKGKIGLHGFFKNSV